jgi:protoporphyrinogen oxidase
MARHIKEIAVLGGGPAGLAVGHYARTRAMPFVIYEQAKQWGGNCVTHEWNEFRYDSGAHRIHGVDPEVVTDIARLLRGELHVVRSPSFIYKDTGRYTFPLELNNILKTMPVRDLARGLKDLVQALVTRNGGINNFEELAVQRYGKFFAREFLLDYSEKLWGRPCAHLDKRLAGRRLAGLRLGDILKGFAKQNGASPHMEGEFYYPKGGIGRLMDALAESCGPENISLEKSVTRILHDNHRVLALELNNKETVEVDEVVSTLPVNRLLQMLDPMLPSKGLAQCFHFRNLVLVALFLNKAKIMDAASVYFPGSNTMFTRAYEPRNRCVTMSPPGKTSLVVEIPCDPADSIWVTPDQQIAQVVIDAFGRLGWLQEREILCYSVQRMQAAYPVIQVESRESFDKAKTRLKHITNLNISGRNGRFSYSWIHDQIRWGKSIIERLAS